MIAEARQGTTSGVATERAVRSRTPSVYVPRRFRIGGIDGIPTGAAIVGTPQGDGMVAIDVQRTPYVEPNPEAWHTWVAEAAQHHTADDDELLDLGEERETRFVSEAALVEIGKCIQGHVRIDERWQGAELSRWLQAGRADHVVGGGAPPDAESPFPHEA